MTVTVWSAADITDGCDLPDLNLYLSEDGEVFYNSSEAIGGFQFNVEGATLNDASDGDAGGAEFMISTNPGSGLVLGFSLTGATISAGCGTLIELDLTGEAIGLSGIIMSDAAGSEIYFEYYDGGDEAVLGCMDESACNYNPDATEDDGSCLENDCAGECGGDAGLDECGICGGDNSSCSDCAGVPNGDSYEDNCGICDNDPSNDCVQDCNGDWGGTAEEDECGVCDGDGSTCEDFECDSAVCMNITNVNIDAGTLDIYMINDEPVGGFQFELTNIEITGASGGTASDADFTVNTWDSQVLAFSLTGATIPPGSGILTQVSFSNFDGEICFGDDTGSAGNNVISGIEADGWSLYIGTTWGDCYCASDVDECGVCGGDDSSCLDCADVPNGDSVIDSCGTCDNDSSNDCVQDCNGEWGGTAVEDICGECGGSGTYVDECGVCEGPGAIYECGCEDFPSSSGDVAVVTLDYTEFNLAQHEFTFDGNAYINENGDWSRNVSKVKIISTSGSEYILDRPSDSTSYSGSSPFPHQFEQPEDNASRNRDEWVFNSYGTNSYFWGFGSNGEYFYADYYNYSGIIWDFSSD